MFQEELDSYKVADRHTCNASDFGYNFKTKVEDIICTCDGKGGIKQILEVPRDTPPVICYPQCPRSLFTAAMRQTRDSATNVNMDIVKEYHKSCDRQLAEMDDMLRNFTYSVDEYMNHITTRAKQDEVIEFYNEYTRHGTKSKPSWYNNDYTLFAKKEKQLVSLQNGKYKYPKCRAISACPANVKWIMGPVIYALEKLFATYPGYKIPYYDKDLKATRPAKTWEEQQEVYKVLYDNGLINSCDIDGSAWDSTILHHMKYLPYLVYQKLVEYGRIHHVDPELFLSISTQRYRKLIVKTFINGRTKVILNMTIDSTTFSGSMDTTFSNTLINLSVARFVRETLGLEWHEMPSFNAGDDHAAFFGNMHLNLPIEEVTREIWLGLGLVPKHINIGDFTTITFCSTNLIPYIHDKETHFKIVRQVDKLFPLAHYSVKAMSLSLGQMKTYYNEMAQGNEKWDADMPFYSLYSRAYRLMSDRIDTRPLPIATEGKPKLSFGEIAPRATTYEEEIAKTRISPQKVSNEVVYDYLLKVHGMTREIIRDLEDNVLLSQTIHNPLMSA